MACNIQYQDGKISVLDDSGNPSKLYKDAVDKFGEEKGLEIYLVSKSNSFLDFFTGENEPTLQEVTNYVASNNRTEAELNQNQKADLINVLISNPDFKAEDFYDEFGMFVIPKKHYSRYELLTLENEEQIKEAIDALTNTENFTPNVEVEGSVEQVNEKNAFGKLVNINPAIAEQKKLKEEVLNGEREDYKTAEVFIETLDGEIIPAKNNNTEQILPLLVKQNFKTDLIDSLQNISLSTLQQAEEQTRIVLKVIEDDLISQGIDVIGLAQKPIDQELVDFLNTAKTFINSPTKDNTEIYAEKSDVYFERNLEPKIDIVKSDKTDRNYVKLNTNLTEEQLYEKKGLIQSELGKGIYIKTAKEDLTTLYENLRTYTEKYPKGQTLEQYVQKQIAEMNYDNAENAEAIVLYKMYFGVEEDVNKIKQLEIINRSNPAPNTYNTWIRSVKDIKTAKEVFEVAFKEGNMYPDFTIENMKKALSLGAVTVYSSKNIENGVFITPSRINAIDYAGGEEKNLQKKTVSLYDIAWIDESEGQYAPTTTKKPQYNNNIQRVQKQFTGDYAYLTEEFPSDFYIKQLKEKQKNSTKYRNFYSNFEVNEKGINILNTDAISMQQIEIYADENLRQYSLISKQMPDLQVDTEINESTRDLVVNNPQTLEDYKNDLFRIDENNLILKNNTEEFVKVNGEIYESVAKQGNLNHFVKLEIPTSDYYAVEVKAPQTNLKLSDYSYLNESPEKFKSVKDFLKGENPEELSC